MECPREPAWDQLYSTFILMMHQPQSKNKIGLYADDSKPIGPENTPNKRASMQNALWVLSNSATLRRLEFNVNKCQTIHFGKKNEKCPYHMLGMDGSRQTIILSEVERDLGVIVEKRIKILYTHRDSCSQSTPNPGYYKKNNH